MYVLTLGSPLIFMSQQHSNTVICVPEARYLLHTSYVVHS